MNSFIMASGITIGKIVVSMLGAFSIVYFDYRFRKWPLPPSSAP
jgi:sn-glycerol 3-phosphate transport system permease protein